MAGSVHMNPRTADSFTTQRLSFDTSLWRIPVEGGPATRVLENLSTHLNVAFAASGIYFVPSAASGFSVQFLDRNTNRIATFASFKGRLNLDEVGGLALSRAFPIPSRIYQRIFGQEQPRRGSRPSRFSCHTKPQTKSGVLCL